MGSLRPEGDSPFELPAAQSVRAYRNGERVTLSFDVALRGKPEKLRIELSKDQAVYLLGELRKAVT